MTWLDIAVLSIIFLSGIIAYQRGLIKTLFSFIALIVSMILTMYIYPYFSEIIIKYTGLYDSIKQSVIKVLNLETIAQNVVSPQDQITYINQMDVPNQLKDLLIANNNSEIYSLLNVNNIGEYIGGLIASLAINIISFLVVFIIVSIAIKIVINILDLISKLPVLHQINKLGGLIVGIFIGVVIVWFLDLVISLMSTNPDFTEIIQTVNESSIAKFLYENNLLMNIVSNIKEIIV